MSLSRLKKRAHSHSDISDQIVKRSRIDNSIPMEELFQFISRNIKLRKMISSVKPEMPEVEILKNAILTGNFENPIFSHENCHVHLLYLLETNAIPFWKGMTAFKYLNALMQFTPFQPIKPEDVETRSLRNVQVYALQSNGEITETGNLFLAEVSLNFKEMLNISLDMTALETFVKSLTGADNWLIGVEDPLSEDQMEAFSKKIIYKDNKALYSTDIFKKRIQSNLPFNIRLYSEVDSTKIVYCYPSFAFINFILNQVSPQPMRMMPIFGGVGILTLYQLHCQNIHPIPFYSPHVNSNLKHPHQYVGGGFINMVHDITHNFLISLIRPVDREKLLKEIVPKICEEPSPATDMMIEKLNDFNLTPLISYQNEETRFETFLRKNIFPQWLTSHNLSINKFGLFSTAPTVSPEVQAFFADAELPKNNQTNANPRL